MKVRSILAGAAAFALLALPAFATDFLGGAVKSTDIGGKMVLTDANGMTLYTFDKDVPGSGKSACSGPCAALWPAVPATAASYSAPYSVITRDDGAKQLAWNGKPLYLFVQDTKPGERKGDNFKNVWHVVAN